MRARKRPLVRLVTGSNLAATALSPSPPLCSAAQRAAGTPPQSSPRAPSRNGSASSLAAAGSRSSSHRTTSSFWAEASEQVEYTSTPPGLSWRQPFQRRPRCRPTSSSSWEVLSQGTRRSMPSRPPHWERYFSMCLTEPSWVHSASTNTRSNITKESSSETAAASSAAMTCSLLRLRPFFPCPSRSAALRRSSKSQLRRRQCVPSSTRSVATSPTPYLLQSVRHAASRCSATSTPSRRPRPRRRSAR
mmetsp:Transcript_16938/g.54165  ORF Transcript_16938/g.54165 Transcript_16938/m.54165 type:complete len:247 (-) Transcript_16938:619-1359(-)